MKRFCSAALILTLLAGCAADAPASDASAMFCPAPARLQQAQTLTEFLPERSDVAAQLTTAQITGVAGTCTFERKKRIVQVEFQTGFSATNGPADGGKPVTLPYFVAITQDDTIIQEYFYTITLSFDGNASMAQATSKPIKIDLPTGRRSRDLEVLVGFQMTQDELDYATAHPVE